MTGLCSQIAMASCLLAMFVSGSVHAEELPNSLVEILSDRLQDNVKAQLAGQTIEEESSRKVPIKVGRFSFSSYREKKSFSVSADPESFSLKLSELDLTDGVLFINFESGCDISGRAHYSAPGAAIPLSVTSNYTARVNVKGTFRAKVDFASLSASISNLHVPQMDVSIEHLRWSNDGLNLLRDPIQSAISDRLNKEKPAALKKLNDELSGQEFSKSLLELR